MESIEKKDIRVYQKTSILREEEGGIRKKLFPTVACIYTHTHLSMNQLDKKFRVMKEQNNRMIFENMNYYHHIYVHTYI